jgi:hypothetical protein
MSAAAMIAMRRNRLVRKFRQAGATDPEHAVTLGSLRERRSWVFDQMVGNGVFVPVPNGEYYMVEQAATEFLHRKRMWALIGTGILLLLLLILWACGLLGK